MMARGPGWRLAEGEGGGWHVEVQRETEDTALTWAHLLRTIRSIATTHTLRPLVIDLREAERLGGAAAQAAGLLLAEYETRGRRICMIVGPDLIHAARLHRLISVHAPSSGRCFLAEDEAADWVRWNPPAVVSA
jgi:hypothetical protein